MCWCLPTHFCTFFLSSSKMNNAFRATIAHSLTADSLFFTQTSDRIEQLSRILFSFFEFWICLTQKGNSWIHRESVFSSLLLFPWFESATQKTNDHSSLAQDMRARMLRKTIQDWIKVHERFDARRLCFERSTKRCVCSDWRRQYPPMY